MARSLLFCTVLAVLTAILPASAQTGVVVKNDNGSSKGGYSNAGWEESVILQPDGPCRVLEIQIYFAEKAGADTIWVVGDPSEGAVPPTFWVHSYNRLIEPLIVQHDGTPGWKTIDVSQTGLRSDGYDRIVIQHRIESDGPVFAYDDNGTSTPLRSFTMNPGETNSLGLQGKYYRADGDFMVRLVVEYDYPDGEGSKEPPAPTLVDATKDAGLTKGDGSYLTSARVSVADWDGDGWDDVAVGSNFFRNRRDGTFENVGGEIGIKASATVWGDYDNDGDLDVYAVNGGENDKLYRNDGGSFTDVTEASGISNPAPTVTPIWFDVDRDGNLDLFISNGRRGQYPNEEFFLDKLWLNRGDGTFLDLTSASGIPDGEPDPYYDCWGAAPCDYNNDGWTDLFVATYRLAPDLLFRNNEGTGFSEVGAATGVRGEPTSNFFYYGHGIGADWGDFDNDGDMDLAVGNLGHPDSRGDVSNPSLIYQNGGAPDFRFEDVHHRMGLKFYEMNAGVIWLDLDLDGMLDLFHCQYSYSAEGEGGEPRRLSRVYLNEGPEKDFHLKDITWHTGALIHGAWTAARLDYDNDGDMDLVVASPREALKLFRNDMERKGRWLEVRLEGADGMNRDAYGSRVYVHAGKMTFRRDLQGGGGGATATQNSNVLHFGLGDVDAIDSMVVWFPDGTREVFAEGIAPDNSYTVRPGNVVRTTLGVNIQRGTSFGIEHAQYSDGAFRLILTGESMWNDVAVEVVDALGSVVARTRLENLNSGMVTVTPAAPPAAGLYLLRVGAGEATATAKVTVVR